MVNISITGNNFEVSEALREATHTKFQKLIRHTPDILNIHVSFTIEHLDQIAKVTLHLPGIEVYASETSDNIYKTLDGVIDKLEIQIKKHKDKRSGD
jgi:putative sigma-54 modulation protein